MFIDDPRKFAMLLLATATLFSPVVGQATGTAEVKVSSDAKKLSPKILNGQDLGGLFRPVCDAQRAGVVEIQSDGRARCLGAVIDDAGHIVTKLSELPERIRCEASDGRRFDAVVVAEDPAWDLALLKTDERNLKALEFADKAFEVGQFIITPGIASDPAGVGVVSVKTRRILGERGFLGVTLGVDAAGVVIQEVQPNTAAAAAQLMVSDVVLSAGGKTVKDRDEFIELIGSHGPGELLELRVKRGEEEFSVTATLGRRDGEPARANARPVRRDFTQRNLSERRTDFKKAMQHDTLLTDRQVGGPILDINGKVVGLNIARSGRTQCLVLPGDVVRDSIARMLEQKPIE